jgi:hypothetical protein
MTPEAQEMPAAGYALAYREARRGLEDQERTAVELRGRAGALIAAAALTTSFFGGQTLARHAIDTPAWVAIGCFVLLAFAVLFVLWPRRDWAFTPAPAKLIATYLEPGERDPTELHVIQRDLALHIGGSITSNRRRLRMLTAAFRAAALMLVAEIVAWMVALLI